MTPETSATAAGPGAPPARGAPHPVWPWDVFIGGYGIAMAATTLLMEGSSLARGGAAAALLALCGWYLGYGGRHLRQGARRPSLLFPLGALALFALALAFHPMAQLGWGVLFPMLFLGCRLRVAAIAAVIAAALPTAVLLLRSGGEDPFLPVSLLIGAAAGGGAILFGAWIGHVMERSTQRAALIAQLESSQEEVELLSHEAGIAEERTRLAREIHDTLAQGFTSIVTLVQAAESELDEDLPAARHHLELATRTARENLAEARAMVAALTPSPLASATLAEAIRRRAELVGGQTSATVGVRAQDVGALPTAIEVVLLRTAQEALANIAKHAVARRISVDLSATDEIVRLQVADDGAGFDPAASTDGYGLSGMRRRAEDIGGTLDIDSRCGTGTTVTLEVPR